MGAYDTTSAAPMAGFPMPPKELVLQLLTNVHAHMTTYPDDRNVVLELAAQGEEGKAPHLEEIIRRRVAEKPDSQLAPYNSQEGAWFLKRSIDKYKAIDPEVLAAAEKFGAFQSGIANMYDKLNPAA